MTITTKHPEATRGRPVALGDDGKVLDGETTIRTARDVLGLSRRLLGEALGLSRRTIENYELGTRSPGPDVLFNLMVLMEADRLKKRKRPRKPD